MKKLLLFAVTMGISAMTFAQSGLLSVDAILEPNGTIITQDPANGSTLIQVTVTSNEPTYTYVGGAASFNFNIFIDGNAVPNPTQPSSNEFLIPILADLAPGGSVDLILATDWGPVADPGSHELCVELVRAVIQVAPFVVTNTDQNKKLCGDYTFAWPVGVSELNSAEISNIKTVGGMMTVFVKNNSNVTELKLMSITGQVVKSIVASNGGQDFAESFDISNLTSGVYIVSIQTENGESQAQKVFVQ